MIRKTHRDGRSQCRERCGEAIKRGKFKKEKPLKREREG